MGNFTVLRVEPVKAAGLGGAESHQMREFYETHIDQSRSALNRVLVGSGNIKQDALEIINRHSLANSKTTIVAADIILTAHSEYFERISPNWQSGNISPQLKKWIDINVAWLKAQYGEGLASVVLHADETAIHLHAVVVPVCTYKIKHRYGEKEVTRINYRHLFADDMATIREARKNKNSDTVTKLGRLQTNYAQAMNGLDLTRGLRNSRATHEEIKEHQRLVTSPTPELYRERRPKPKPVVPALLSRTEETIKVAMVNYADAVVDEYIESNSDAIKIAMAKAKEIDKMRAENERLKQLLVEKDKAAVADQQQIKQLVDQLELNKDQINALRAIDMQLVAARLEYSGGKTWRNAIDMVKELEGIDYKSALAFLHAEFGFKATVATAAEHAKHDVSRVFHPFTTAPEVPVIKQQEIKRAAVHKQLGALGADHYRVTMMSDHSPTYNVGKGAGPDGSEKLFTAAEVIEMVPVLERKNQKEKYNVFITPIDEKNHFVLVDDLTSAALTTHDGYKPNLLLQSSRHSFQAVFVLPKTEVDKGVGNAVFKELNRKYGDPKIQGFVHPFRLAGFANVKDKHRDPVTQHYPFVRVLSGITGICQKIVALARQIAQDTLKPRITATKAAQQLEQVLLSVDDIQGALDGSALIPPALNALAETHYRWCRSRYGPDMNTSVADFMLCEKALAKGYSNTQIAAVIASHSPNLIDRHPNVERYLSDTLAAARAQKSAPEARDNEPSPGYRP